MPATAFTLPTPAELAERIKSEVIADVRNGIVPATVGSFAELHNYVDANCYGGTESLLEEIDTAGPDDDEAHAAALDALCGLANPAQDIVDGWIKSGGINAA